MMRKFANQNAMLCCAGRGRDRVRKYCTVCNSTKEKEEYQNGGGQADGFVWSVRFAGAADLDLMWMLTR